MCLCGSSEKILGMKEDKLTIFEAFNQATNL